MTTSSEPPFRDSLYRLAQVGATAGMQLVQFVELQSGNQYKAQPVEFDDSGDVQPTGDDPLTVINLAEPADADGTIPAETNAVALDVEGRWVVFVRPTSTGASCILAKVTATLSGAAYTVLEQVLSSAGAFVDKDGASTLTAWNLAELSLGPGAAVDIGTLVLVSNISSRYVFDHPTYAKYLD